MKKAFILLFFCCINYSVYALSTLGNAGGGTAVGTACVPATNYIIAHFTITQTVANTTLNTVNFTTTGTYIAADLTNFKLYANVTNTFASAVQIGTTIVAGLGPVAHSFTAIGTPLVTAGGGITYYWIVATMPGTATACSTIAVSAFTNTNIAVAAGGTAGTALASGAQTLNKVPVITATASPTTLCVGDNLTLTGTGVACNAYSWSGPGGYTSAVLNPPVFAVIAGNAGIFTLTATNVCGTTNANTASVAVNPLPTGVTASAAPNPICSGNNLTLTGTATGASTYSWTGPSGSGYSSTFLNPPAFAATAIYAGIYTLTATTALGCNASATTAAVVVNPSPSPITGTLTTCVGATTPLSDIIGGGSWSSSNILVATVDAITGIVTGVSVGTATINYAIGTCSQSAIVTVNALPSSGLISGVSNICVGASTPLSDASPGGTWSVSNTTASISATGLLTGLAIGIDTITYMVSSACGVALTNFTDTISAPANSGFIVGPDTVCAASFALLTDTATGGVWSCSNTNGTISTTGLFSALLSGLDTIYYSVVTGCGSSLTSKTIYIRALPDTGIISGPTLVCVGSTINLSETVTGGVWSSVMGLTSISALGVVTGLTAGIDTIKYSVTNVCGTRFASWVVTVNPIGAGIISGPSVACVGTSVTLTDAIPSGSFSSGNLNATITSGGILTGTNPGTDTITYTVVSVCGTFSTTKVITIQPLPNTGTISGDSTVCQNATITLSETVLGGVWGSSNNLIASVDSTLGIVSGLSGGIVNINYYVTSSFGCVGIASYSVLVNPAPLVNAITGITNQCVGSTSILTDLTPSGVWSSSNITKASIDSVGVVTGLAQGIVTISYSVTDILGCVGIATTPDTVNTIPISTPILGDLQACIGGNTTLYDSTLWGSWMSGDITIATIDATTGVVTGVSAGNVTIYYIVTNNCGMVTDSAIVTVNALPTVQPINAPGVNICAGGSALLTDATTGGTWSSSNTAIATVISTTGWVTGIAAGGVTITYTVTNSLGCSANTTTDLTFGGSLSASVLPGGTASLCHTGFIHMYVVSSASGLNYQWIRYSTLIPGATQNYYNASVAGNYAVEVGNSICSETVAGTSITASAHPLISFVSPNILYTGSFYTYQWLLNGSPIAGATNSVYSAIVNGNYQVAVSNISGCLDTSAVFAVTDLTGVNNITFENSINYYPNPATSVINIDAPQQINVQILSPDGKVIIDEKNAREINVSALRSGLYIIRILDQQNTLLKTGKFTKL